MSSDDDSKDCKWIEKGYLPPAKKHFMEEPGGAGELATPRLEGDEGEAPTAKVVDILDEEEIKAEDSHTMMVFIWEERERVVAQGVRGIRGYPRIFLDILGYPGIS